MPFRFQLRRSDKKYHVVVSEDYHTAIHYYAAKKGTTMTDAVHRLLCIAFLHEFPGVGRLKDTKENDMLIRLTK